MTLLLNRSVLEGLLDPGDCMEALRKGFTGASTGVRAQRAIAALPGPGTATSVLPGVMDGVPAYTAKVNAKYPGTRPALRGVVCLHDLNSGELLALLDSATITAWRTGLAAALGTHVLARRNAEAVTVIGAGAQSELVLRGLTVLREPRFLTVTDLDAKRAEDFARRHGERMGIPFTVARDPRTAAKGAEIIVMATWSRRPLLDETDVTPGTHITSLGADEHGKTELSADLLRDARVVVDDVSLAVEHGALAGAGLGLENAAGTLHDLLCGQVPGRVKDREITVYAPVGLPWQDLALSWTAYHAARAARLGTAFDFLN